MEAANSNSTQEKRELALHINQKPPNKKVKAKEYNKFQKKSKVKFLKE